MENVRLFPLMERAAKRWPNDIALVCGSDAFTFAQLNTESKNLVATLLQKAGITPGCKVGLMCPNGPDYVVGSFALFMIDGIVVPIFPGLRDREVMELAREMKVDAFCYSPQFDAQIPERGKSALIQADLLGGQVKLHIKLCSQPNTEERDRKRLAKRGSSCQSKINTRSHLHTEGVGTICQSQTLRI